MANKIPDHKAPIYLADSKSDLGVVREPLRKEEKAYGTDIDAAKKNLESYEAKMPRMLDGIKKSKAKAADKKKYESKIKRMHKYFQDGVTYAQHVSDVKNNPDPGMPYFSDSNTKLVKDGIISFNIPAGHSCPGKGDCFGICYAMQGPQSWPDAMKKRVHNWGLAERPDFVERTNAELKKWPKKTKKSSRGIVGDIVRIHDSGDFYSQDYIDKWHQIAKANPDKKFYAYTKALHLDWKKLHELPNFTVIQSVGSKHDHLIDPHFPHSYIFPTPEAMHAAGYADTHDSDMPAAMAKNNPKIGLVVHGIFSGAYDKDKYGEQFQGKALKKSEFKVPVQHLPDVYKFDQIDHVNQLSHSSHPADKLTLISLKHHGETNPPHANGIDDGLESLVSYHMKNKTSGSGSPAPLAMSEKTMQKNDKKDQIQTYKEPWFAPKKETPKPVAPKVAAPKAEEKTFDAKSSPKPPAQQGNMWKFLLAPKGKLEKQTGMDAAASSIRSAFGSSTATTPPPPPPTPAPAPASAGTGSLAGNITAGLNRFMGKSSEKPKVPKDLKDHPEYDRAKKETELSGKLGPKKYYEHRFGKPKELKKDDKPHAPGSPKDKAHDVIEEKQPLKTAIGEVPGKEKGKVLSHIRGANTESNWKRSPANQQAGKDVHGVMGKSNSLEKKQGVPKGVDPAKHERCVRDVKAKGDVKNPWAVCSASLQKMSKMCKSYLSKKTLEE